MTGRCTGQWYDQIQRYVMASGTYAPGEKFMATQPVSNYGRDRSIVSNTLLSFDTSFWRDSEWEKTNITLFLRLSLIIDLQRTNKFLWKQLVLLLKI